MAGRDIIVIGTSAGGAEALVRLVRGLPAGFPASVFVVCHFPAGGRSVLPEILSRAGKLLSTHAVDGDIFRPGHVYIAPPDHHLILTADGRTRLTRDARENHNRPAVDPLFRSAAKHYGKRVVAVILTGGLFDGTAGLMAVRSEGGFAVIQDPTDAEVAAMPQNAIELAGADRIVPLNEIPELLVQLVQDPTPHLESLPMQPSRDSVELMPNVVANDLESQAQNGRGGKVSTFTCPDCGGALWQVDEPRLIQFRCHVGHAYNAEALLAEQSEALEAALWTSVRTFREKSVLGRQLATQERLKGNIDAAARFDEQAAQAKHYAQLILDHVLHAAGGTTPAGEEKPTH